MIAPRRPRQVPIDWESVKHQLKRAEEATREALNPSPEQARAVMAQRARALAEPVEPPPAPGAVAELVTFVVGDELYAVETKFVRDVGPLAHLTPVPATPGWVAGVTSRRGDLLVVVDLRELLGLVPGHETESLWVVVVGAERAEFGLLSEGMPDLLSVPRNEVLPVSEPGTGRGDPLVVGLTAAALAVLDGQALLRDPRLFVEQLEIGSAQEPM